MKEGQRDSRCEESETGEVKAIGSTTHDLNIQYLITVFRVSSNALLGGLP